MLSQLLSSAVTVALTMSVNLNQDFLQDYDSSEFDTVQYELIEAELPSDRVVVDEDSIISYNFVRHDEYFSNIDDNNFVLYNSFDFQTFRDISTYLTLFRYWDSGEVEVLAPINYSEELFDIFTPYTLVYHLLNDVLVKSNRYFTQHLAETPAEAFAISNYYTPAMLADAQADVMRAEYIYNMASASEQAELDELMETFYIEYDKFEQIYNQALTEEPMIEYITSEKVVVDDEIQEKMDKVEEYLSYFPDDILNLLSRIYFVAPEEMPSGWDGTDLAAYASHQREIYFDVSEEITPWLVFHELGHVIDFSGFLPLGTADDDYLLFSLDEDWLAIHEEEWDIDGSYYQDPVESFAQSFSAVAYEYFLDEVLDPNGTDGISNRPLSTEYMWEFFEWLEIPEATTALP